MLSESLKNQLSQTVASHPVVLFMKGNRAMPQCGFSATVVQILNELLPSYQTVDVLSDPALRDGIKEFSQWPTIPQLYVNGKFVGGCDIVREMHAAGELRTLLGPLADAAPEEVTEPVGPPNIVITQMAARAFQGVAAEDGGQDVLRLEIGGGTQYDLFFAPAQNGDVVAESNGVKMHFDVASARRAHGLGGLTIDFVDAPAGGGFKITSGKDAPSEAAPPQVKSMTPAELKARFDRGDKVELFDVRPESERARAKLEAARMLDREAQDHLFELPKDALIVFHCHHGGRSRGAAEHFAREGFTNVHNLEGGIDAWSLTVDPSVPRY